MLRFRSISVVQFKNYTQRQFHFEHDVTGICGRNGMGKTNLLDAVYYCCFTKSYFTRQDAAVVQHGQTGLRIEAELEKNGLHEKLVCVVRENGKKEISINGQEYEKLSAHIGHYPCVIIAPDDIQLIIGAPEDRRRFLDTMLCQLDPVYLSALSKHNRLLLQRNSLLKSFAETGRTDFALLDVLDSQLAEQAGSIYRLRSEFLTRFLPLAAGLYLEIAGTPEMVNLVYESELEGTTASVLLQQNRSRDCAAQRTTMGVHRDDLLFMLNGQPFRNTASQGQRKSLLFALKLTEMELLKEKKGFTPVLLLDDVFEKLDDERISNLLQRVCGESDSQVFITDTNEERLRVHLEKASRAYSVISL